MVSEMSSLYDMLAEDCARIAAKTQVKSDKDALLRLAQQWKVVEAERSGELGKSAVRTDPLQAPERR
jgi:hypothetical protein